MGFFIRLCKVPNDGLQREFRIFDRLAPPNDPQVKTGQRVHVHCGTTIVTVLRMAFDFLGKKTSLNIQRFVGFG
jgi:hypothetical protein